MSIKKIFLLSVIFIFVYSISCTASNSLKRNTAVFPLFFDKSSSKYTYLADILRDEIKITLENYCRIIDFKSVNDAVEKLGLSNKYLTDADVFNAALTIDADNVVFCDFQVVNDRIKLNFKFMDIITGEKIVESSKLIKFDFDMYRYIRQFIQENSDKIINKVTYYNINLLNNLDTVKNKNITTIINNLISQNDSYWKVILDIGDVKLPVEIPFAKNVLIFINKTNSNYTVDVDGIKNDEKNKIKIFSFNNELNKTRLINIIDGDKIIKYKYVQSKPYEVVIKYIDNDLFKDVTKTIFFIDDLINMSTSGHVGVDFRIGFALPLKSLLYNGLYFNFSLNTKALNYVEDETGIYFYRPSYKLKFGFGYQRFFYIKKIVAISIGLESGFEFSILSFIIKNKIKYDLFSPAIGFPSVYFGFPFEVNIFANNYINLIVGVEPVLRLAMNYIVYNGSIWIEYLDETRGAGFKYFRYNIGNYITCDLFFYDMPVYIGFRVKI
jgi:hypothetical protein